MLPHLVVFKYAPFLHQFHRLVLQHTNFPGIEAEGGVIFLS